MARATFRACHCKDYARVDIRIDPTGRPFVLEKAFRYIMSHRTGKIEILDLAGLTITVLDETKVVDGARFGLFMPAKPRVGAKYCQKSHSLGAFWGCVFQRNRI